VIHFVLDIDPIAKGRPRFNRLSGHAYTPAKTRGFENQLRAALRRNHPVKPILGPIRVSLGFFINPPRRKVREYPTCRPDLDNFQKAIMDAGNGILWADDSQIIRCDAAKYYDWTDRRGRIAVTIEEMNPRPGRKGDP
jgi:Holliday junction resolvase RusA-like endonuclease